MLAPGVGFGGAVFGDAGCQRQLSGAGTIAAAALDRFAECLATLPLARSAQGHEGVGMVLFEYAPGIQLEAKFDPGGDGTLTYLGYAGRRDIKDALPVMTHAAFLAHRRDAPPLVLDAATRARVDEDVALQIKNARRLKGSPTGPTYPMIWSWMKVCVDANGAVTSARPRKTMSLAASLAFAAWAKTWTFEPFVIGDRAMPACAELLFDTDAPSTKPLPSAPAPVPIEAGDRAVIPIKLLGDMTEGEMLIAPTDAEKTAIGRYKLSPLIGTVFLCIDETGAVTTSLISRTTRFRTYDHRLQQGVLKWRFKPYLIAGKPEPVCAVATFAYRQR